MKHVERFGLKGVPEPAMRLAHIRSKRRRFIGPGSWCYLLANLTQAVSVFLASQSRSCEIYPKSGRGTILGRGRGLFVKFL